VPKASRGWDNAKKVNGRKRHIAVDATGLVLDVVITAASVQDRVAARPLLWKHPPRLPACPPGLGRCQIHRHARRLAATLKMTVPIVSKRHPRAFEVLPRRWVVERTFAWISKHRRTTPTMSTCLPATKP
jgi:putative transposase